MCSFAFFPLSFDVSFVFFVSLVSGPLFLGHNFIAHFLAANIADRAENRIEMLRGQRVDGFLHTLINIVAIQRALDQGCGLPSLPRKKLGLSINLLIRHFSQRIEEVCLVFLRRNRLAWSANIRTQGSSSTPLSNSFQIPLRTLSNPPFFLNECRRLWIDVCCAGVSGSSSSLNFFRCRLSMSIEGRFALVDCASGTSSESPMAKRARRQIFRTRHSGWG